MDNKETAARAATLKRGREVLEQEARALIKRSEELGDGFCSVVEAILACRGRVVMTGMGKHGLIARKIAATLASTGTPSFFMHPAEGAHGDLGMIDPGDMVIAVSNSGNTAEVLGCLPYIKRNGNLLVAMTGGARSELARHADIVLDVSVEAEACPLGLAPTTSTTMALAMGDALAVVLLERRGFLTDDFALRHPAGTLGRRLLLRVADLMNLEMNPVVSVDQPFSEAVAEITRKTRGAVSVVDASGELVGIVTDGDLRRILQRAATDPGETVASILARPVGELMTRDPMRIDAQMLAAKAMNVMEGGPRKVFVLPVVDEQNHPVAMLHLHDLVSAGV